MHLLDPLNQDYRELTSIFEKIYNKSAVAFLGAGASVTNKTFLSKELIQLYEGKLMMPFDTDDIIKFVDMLEATPGISRPDFDKFVVDQLDSLVSNEGHEIFVTIPWKQVVTTNYDTLIEEASRAALQTHKTHFRFKVMRSRKQLDYQNVDNEIPFIKLNGCKTDLSEFPLVFSTEDFRRQTNFYRKVLSPFKGFTSEIVYIAFGYSFTDIFSEKLLERLANKDYRQKRRLYCVTPSVNSSRLGYFENNDISIVQISFVDFFRAYQTWYIDSAKNYLKGLQKFSNPDQSGIKIPVETRLYLDNNLIQLKNDYKIDSRIKKVDFYLGEEPNFQVIVDDFDIQKELSLTSLDWVIQNSFTQIDNYGLPRLILIDGDFGTGKTTFTLRAIYNYINKSSRTLAFEITRSLGINQGYLAVLIKESNASQFIFYSDNIESDSVFKSFNELRVSLAAEQYSNIKIIFISSIRQNILAKFKSNRKFQLKNYLEFHYDSCYTPKEISELLDNLKETGLIDFRDVTERNGIVEKVSTQYNGDSFITLYKLITNGNHAKLLTKAYNELTKEVQEAFKITALIHRFNMLCPASVIKNALKSYDWPTFTEKIIKGDGKNILFQVESPTTTSDPDLLFKTKHPVISEALIETIFTNQEKNSLYKSIFSAINYSQYNTTFVVDLIKNIRLSDKDITQGQIDNYYELSKKEFESSPHFMIGYFSNVESNTSSISILENLINSIRSFESTLERRNHYLIHKKGTVSFKMARLALSQRESSAETLSYVNAAIEWFEIKKILDPDSSYSYVDYINLLVWKLKNLKLSNDEKLDTHLSLQTLFDEAFHLLATETSVIQELYESYCEVEDVNQFNDEFKDYLLELYKDVNFRPKATILLYYYYENRDEDKSYDFVLEMEKYQDNAEIVYFLFKFYGETLYDQTSRMKFHNIIRKNYFLKSRSELRYYYYQSIAEFYNWRWKDGKNMLRTLKEIKNFHVHSGFNQYWRNDVGDDAIFDGIIIIDGKVKKVQIEKPFFKSFLLAPGNYDKYKTQMLVQINLKFTLHGILAEILDTQ